SGVVRWTGDKPTAGLTVGPDGGLADAVVWIVAPPPVAAAPAAEPVQVVRRQGSFQPHVAVVRAGTPVQLAAPDEVTDFFVDGAAAFSRKVAAGTRASF